MKGALIENHLLVMHAETRFEPDRLIRPVYALVLRRPNKRKVDTLTSFLRKNERQRPGPECREYVHTQPHQLEP